MNRNSISSLVSIFALTVLSCLPAFAETRTFKEVAVEINGTRFWFPSTLTVKKGDKVEILPISKIPGENNTHGFAIKKFGVEVLVNDKGIVEKDSKGKSEIKNKIEFVANEAGIFPITCQLHPGHVGGELVVLE